MAAQNLSFCDQGNQLMSLDSVCAISTGHLGMTLQSGELVVAMNCVYMVWGNQRLRGHATTCLSHVNIIVKVTVPL